MGLLAIPLRQLTSHQRHAARADRSAGDCGQGRHPRRAAPQAAGSGPVFRLKTADGTMLLDLAALPAGESEHDAVISLADGGLDLAGGSGLRSTAADTAVFLTVMPDGHGGPNPLC